MGLVLRAAGVLQGRTVKSSHLNRNMKIMEPNGPGHKGPWGPGGRAWSTEGFMQGTNAGLKYSAF